MVIKAVSWLLFIVTIWGSGFVFLRIFRVRGWERIALGFVIGATLVPFVLFLASTFTHLHLMDNGRGGFLSAGLILLTIFLLLFIEFVFAKSAPRQRLVRDSGERRITGVIELILFIAVVVFFYLVVEGVTQPIYGWDEFSYWLYAGKLLYLSGGSSTIMSHDLYSSYPLGFPYLVAWLYHFLGGDSVSAAKWISPLISLATLIVIYRALMRTGVRRLYAWLGVALVTWGSFLYLEYNWVAFGEMIYVDTYSVGLLYATLWLRDHARSDLLLAGLLIGLSTFLRVDGFDIAIFTTLLLFAANIKNNNPVRWPEISGFLALVLVPALAWYVFRSAYHLDSGWTTRISLRVISERAQSSVLPDLLKSMWETVANLQKYPIDLLLPLLVIIGPFTRKREVYFLTAVSITQLVYLFVAYLSVFTTYEAAHASSLPRYMLRNDPLIALAYVYLLNGKNQLSNLRRKSKRPKRSARKGRTH